MRFVMILLAAAASLLAYRLEPVEVAKDTYCFIGDYHGPTAENGGFVSNVCLAKSGEDILLMDAGPTYAFAKQIDAQAQKLFGKGVTMVAVTNYHDDRILGASYFEKRGVPIYVAAGTKAAIKKHAARFERIKNAVDKESYKETRIPKKLTEMEGNRLELTKDAVLIKPGKAAQSPTDILIYLRDRGVVFTGNILFDGRMINFAEDSDMQGWLEAIEKIKALNPEVVVQGHGDKFSPDAAIKVTETYLLQLKDQVGKLYDQGVSLGEVTDKTDLDSAKHLNHYGDLNGKNISHYYLDLEWAEFQ